jgi:hypothetical protein
MNDFVDGGEKAAAKSIVGDAYVSLKSYFKRLDLSETKLTAYIDGLNRSLCNVQIMGMRNARDLKQLYVTLSFRNSEDLEKEEEACSEPDRYTDSQILVEGFSDALSSSKIEDTLKDLGYDVDFFEDFPEGAPSNVEAPRRPNIAISETSSGVEVIETLAQAKRSVVVAGPGSGKTTLLKYCALAHTGQLPAPAGLEPKLPLFLPLRDLKRRSNPKPDANWLIETAAIFAGELSGISFSTDWLTGQLKKGNCLLLLDGLDEVANEHRANLLTSIQAFEKKYPENQIVVSCRKSVFNVGLPGFSVFEVKPFTLIDIKSFATNWFRDDVETATKFIVDFEASEAAQDICRTPLLCTLFLIMYGYARSLPSHRAELYERCIDALLFHWDTYRAIERSSLSSDLSHARKKSVLSEIARKTFDKHAYIFRKTILLNLVSKELEALGIDGNIEASEFIHEIEDNHGLLVQRGADRYAFSHLSFQEYFAAYNYVHAHQISELFQNLKRDHRYRETFLLAVELSFDPSKLLLGAIAMATRETSKNGFYHELIREIITIRIPIDPKIRLVMQSIAETVPLVSDAENDFEDEEIENDIPAVDKHFDDFSGH